MKSGLWGICLGGICLGGVMDRSTFVNLSFDVFHLCYIKYITQLVFC